MEAKRQKLMDQSEIDDLVVYDPEGESQSGLSEPDILKNQIEVVDLCEPEPEIEKLVVCNPEESQIYTCELVSTNNSIQDVDREPESQGTLTDDEKLRDLLKKWGSMNFYEAFRRNNINYGDLHSLEDMDYSMLVRNGDFTIKELMVFRKAHREWKNALSECKSTVSNTQNFIDLKKILENEGSEITSYYKSNSNLTDPLREQLVQIIIKGRKLSRSMMDNLADQICVIFPGEKKRVYYDKKPTNRNPTGMLYVRYCQSRTTKTLAKSVESEATDDEEVAFVLTDEIQISIDFVNDKGNFQDLTLTTMLFEHWRACYAYRYSKEYTAAEVLDEWPLLQENDAIPMILDDFLTKYGHDIANSLKNKWSNFIFKNMTVIAEGIKNPRPKKDLLQAQSENDCNARDISIFMAFHHLQYIIPSRCTVKKKSWTPTIPESQGAFLKIITNSNSIASKMKEHKVLYDTKGLTDHPIIFEEKKSGTKNYFVAVCQTIYICSSLIDAVDAAFKFYVMFKIPKFRF